MTVLEALRAYARDPAPEADRSTDGVMRALMQHQEYLVPIGWLAALGIGQCDKLVVFSEQGGPPPGELWVFTDEERAHFASQRMSARGEVLGTWGTPFAGAAVFGALDPRLRKVKVNPNTELDTFWFIPQASVPFAQIWASAIAVERALAEPVDPESLRALRAFQGWQVLLHPSGAVATAVGAGGFARPAMVFTAPDCAREVTAEHPGLRTMTVAGEELFRWLPTQPIDGILVNPLGPGPTFPLARQICELALLDGEG